MLVERLRAGDEEALNALVDRYYDRVRRIARIRIGPRLASRTDSEDLVQETFAIAFRKIGELELENHSSIIRYLSRVLENQIRGAVDYFSAQKRHPARGELLSAEETAVRRELSDAPGREKDPLDQASLRELKACYDASVEELRPHYREAILLREYADASWSELQEALDCPTENAARQLYARAQLALAARLRTRLGGLDPGDG